MTNLFSLKDQIHQGFDYELKAELTKFVKQVSPLFGKMKSQLISQVMDSAKKNYKCLPEETIRRLQTNLAVGGKDLQEEEWQKILVDSVALELSAKAGTAFHSTSTIASDYLYEKIQDQLQDISDELFAEEKEKLQAEIEPMTPRPMEANKETTQKEPAKPPAKVPPKIPPPMGTKPSGTSTPPPAASAKTTPPAAKGKAPLPPKKGTGKDIGIESLAKAEVLTEHATKGRPQIQQKRKPPTRKPRPAPPAAALM